jgi:hypothetical protein
MNAQKSFRDSALRYITTSSPGEAVTESKPAVDTEPMNEAPAFKMKPNPAYIETKSRRVQLLLQPTLHKKLTEIARSEQKSFNELVHTILSDYTSKIE